MIMETVLDYETVGLEQASPDFKNLFGGWLYEDKIQQDLSPPPFNKGMLIAHNEKYDSKCALKAGIDISQYQFYDTQIAFKILREDLPREAYKLENLAGLYYEYPNYKKLVDFKDKKDNYWDTPEKLEQLRLYNRHDLYATRRLKEVSEPALKRHGMWNLFLMTMDFIKELSYAEMRGIQVDLDELAKQEVILKEKEEAVSQYFQTVAPINWNSPAQVLEYFKEQGFAVKNVNKVTLKELALHTKIAETLLDWRKIQKQLKTYTEGFRNKLYNSIYYPDYNLLGTVTGRLSERFIQVLPRPTVSPFKKCITSKFKDGYLLECDWDSLELKLVAEISKDPKLIKELNSGIDIHQRTLDTFPHLGDRTRAKNVNYSACYGGKGWTLIHRYGLTQEQSDSFLVDFFKKYVEVKHWHIKTDFDVMTKGFVKNICGRVRHTDNRNEAYNFPIQSLGSELNKIMFIKISQALKNFSSHVVAEIHDSIVIDISPEEKEEVIQEVRRCYSNIREYFYRYFSYQLKLNYTASMKVGRNLFEVEKV